MKHVLPVIIAIFFIAACSDEVDVFFNEPTVEVQFFNIDSLVKVNDSLLIVSDSILFLTDSINVWGDSINVLNDSIENLTILIESGQTELEGNRDMLNDFLSTLSLNLVGYTKLDSLLDLNNAKLNSVKSDIEGGKILISTLTNVGNGNTLSYEDSASLYSLPLSMTADISSYMIKIDNNNYDLELVYSRTNEENEKSRIVVTAFDVAVNRHTFDSLNVICTTSLCENDGVSIQVYF